MDPAGKGLGFREVDGGTGHGLQFGLQGEEN